MRASTSRSRRASTACLSACRRFRREDSFIWDADIPYAKLCTRLRPRRKPAPAFHST
jgi:hypothetical protein